MAIQKDFETVFGIKLTDAYCRVDNIVINEKTKMVFLLNTYADKTAKEIHTQTFQCAYVLDGENPLAQAYKYLKTLPEFIDSQDC
jgi:hypothetical protein